jgi:ATP-dependent RNA helicase RhlE
MGFTTFGLSEPILEGIREAGYTVPTPIQTLAIGPALAGRDLIGRAETGTGKTAAFVLPLLHRLSADRAEHAAPGRPRALVLAPTRELAQQVHLAAEKYGKRLPLRSMSIYGGVGFDAQEKLLRRGVDIVIATPGRLLDHLQRRSVDLSAVQYLVLDEADRMLDMGFIKDVRSIIDRLPRKRQTLLFSATMPESIAELASEILHNPETVEAGESQGPAPTIAEEFYQVPRETKLSFLLALLEQEHLESVLVFSRTKHGADKICRRLDRSGVAATAIHSNRTQSQRERALQAFKNGSARVLVATDIAARGIDVTGISHVINYDVPRYAEDYVHRIGRTGRAGATGHAITFVGSDELQYLRRIEQFTGKRVQTRPLPGGVSLGAPSPPPERTTRPTPAPASSRHPARERQRREPAAGEQHRHQRESGHASRPEERRRERPHQEPKQRHALTHRQPQEEHRGRRQRSEQPPRIETSWSNYRRPTKRRSGPPRRHR